jgi:hypothetical protein
MLATTDQPAAAVLMPELGAPLVRVRWHDAWFDVDHDAEKRDDYLVETVGFRIAADDRYLHVAAERLPDGEGWRAITHIPIVVIDEVVELTVVLAADLNGHEPMATVVGGRRET